MTEYTVYKGDEFQFIGTVKECAARMGVSTETVKYYTKPAYKRKLEKRKSSNALIVIKVEDDE